MCNVQVGWPKVGPFKMLLLVKVGASVLAHDGMLNDSARMPEDFISTSQVNRSWRTGSHEDICAVGV